MTLAHFHFSEELALAWALRVNAIMTLLLLHLLMSLHLGVDDTCRQAVEVAGGNGHEDRGVRELNVTQDLLDEMCPRD